MPLVEVIHVTTYALKSYENLEIIEITHKNNKGYVQLERSLFSYDLPILFNSRQLICYWFFGRAKV